VLGKLGIPVPEYILQKLPDRTLYQFASLDCSSRFYAACEKLMVAKKLIYTPSWTVANHGATALMGWRENVSRYSLQIVAHENLVVELDIDLFNPLFGDVYSAVGHWAEVTFGGTTNPFKVKKGLDKRYGLSAPHQAEG
jgi:hypothetical protein